MISGDILVAMTVTDNDLNLLREFSRNQSQDAFTALVQRHLGLVYCAALRQVRSPQLAEEVAQSVFTDLARNARRLTSDTVLVAWLYEITRRTAINVVRGEVRRQRREQTASEMNPMDSSATDWTHIAPLLDEAMQALDEIDRTAVLLRYFENKTLREVGQTLGTSDDAAQKRVSRAIERLRQFFAHRGVAVGASGLIIVISANAVAATPIGLCAAIAAASALAGTTIAASATTTITKAIAITTVQKTLIAATLAVWVATGIYQARQASHWRRQVQTLRQQQAEQIQELTHERDIGARQLAGLRDENERLNQNAAELIRLRGEVGMLRRQQREVTRTAATAPSRESALPGQTQSDVKQQLNSPRPFQIQLVLNEPADDTEVMTQGDVNAGGVALNVRKTPLLDQTALSSAAVTTDQITGASRIDIELTQTGREQFAQLTKENINKQLAIVMNGKLYAAPWIMSEIPGGKLQISGSFTEKEASELASKINEAIGSH